MCFCCVCFCICISDTKSETQGIGVARRWIKQEFERISDRGGVLGAMETGYQRGRIQEESMKYETKKHDGSYPLRMPFEVHKVCSQLSGKRR